MAAIEEIKEMLSEGISEEDIMKKMIASGLSEKETLFYIEQAKIKEAISPSNHNEESNLNPSSLPQGMTQEEYQTSPVSPPMTQEYSDMTPSMLTQQEAPQQEQYQYPPQQYGEQQYQDYTPYQPSISAETMSEIADQIASEKVSPFKDKVEKLLDHKTLLSSQIDSLSSRLERIEKIIDKLQLSVLQKVGEYVNDVSDLKKEVIETQKSFKAMHKTHSAKHAQTHHTH